MMKYGVFFVVLSLSTFLVGCGCPQAASPIPAETIMSQPIQLSEVPDSAMTVYFQLHNHTSLSTRYLRQHIRQRLLAEGYHFESQPQYAHYLLDVNVKRLLLVTQTTALQIGSSPYGVSLATVPLATDCQPGFYAGVADIKLVEKAAYATNGRQVYRTRLIAYPRYQNIKRRVAIAVIEQALVKRIGSWFNTR